MLLPAPPTSIMGQAPIPTYALAAKTKARADRSSTTLSDINIEKNVPKPENPYETVTVDSSGMVATIPKTVQELESNANKNEGKYLFFTMYIDK